jgi:hypothetical protein
MPETPAFSKILKSPTKFFRGPSTATRVSAPELENHWIYRYGDLAYDFAASLFWSNRNGKIAIRRLYLSKEAKTLSQFLGSDLERAAVFRLLLTQLRETQWRYMRKLTTAEQRMLDGNLSEEGRLKQFDSYLHRLSFDELALLLLRDKLGVPSTETAAILETSEASLQLQRQHAYEALSDWIWDSSTVASSSTQKDCFHFRKKSTSFFDGKATPTEASTIEQHLERCSDCAEAFRRIQLLQKAARELSRNFLSADERGHKIAEEKVLPDFRAKTLRFADIPWFFRTGIESLVITLLVLFAVALIPRFQRLYEASVNQRLDTLIASNTDETPLVDLKTTNISDPTKLKSEVQNDFGEEDRIQSGEDLPPLAAEGDSDLDETPETKTEPAPTGAGPSEVWRFSLRTPSPKEIRLRVIEKLKEMGATPETVPGMAGLEAPGGIQFNLVVDRAWLSDIRKFLNSLSSRSTDDRNQARTQNPLSTTEPLRWYRSSSKTSLPAGKTRIIIWLSQI